MGLGPRTERARVYSSFLHDALLVLSFTAPVLRQEITYHRPSQASFSGGIFRWLNIRNNSHSVIHYSCKIRSQHVVTNSRLQRSYKTGISESRDGQEIIQRDYRVVSQGSIYNPFRVQVFLAALTGPHLRRGIREGRWILAIRQHLHPCLMDLVLRSTTADARISRTTWHPWISWEPQLRSASMYSGTLGSPEGGICAHYPRSRGLARPVSGPITLFSVLAVMIALDRVHIDTHRSPHIGSKLRYVRAPRGVG